MKLFQVGLEFEEVVSLGMDWLLVRGYDSEDGIEVEEAYTEDGIALHNIPEQFLEVGLWFDIGQALRHNWEHSEEVSEVKHSQVHKAILAKLA